MNNVRENVFIQQPKKRKKSCFFRISKQKREIRTLEHWLIHHFKQGVALTGRNTTGPPCSVAVQL